MQADMELKKGCVQANMVIEKELRVLHFDPKEAESTVYHTRHSLSI